MSLVEVSVALQVILVNKSHMLIGREYLIQAVYLACMVVMATINGMIIHNTVDAVLMLMTRLVRITTTTALFGWSMKPLRTAVVGTLHLFVEGYIVKPQQNVINLSIVMTLLSKRVMSVK